MSSSTTDRKTIPISGGINHFEVGFDDLIGSAQTQKPQPLGIQNY